MKTGEIIKHYREKSGMTQKQLSEKVCYENPQFVSLVENGHSQLPVYAAKSFCTVLHIPINKMKKSFMTAYELKLDSELGS